MKAGFTFIELLAVLLIIGILLALGAGGYGLAQRRAKADYARADIEKLRLALEEYRTRYGCYPEQDAAGPLADPAVVGFLTNAVEGIRLKDPWNQYYQYRRAAGAQNRFVYRLWSTELEKGNP